MKTKNQNETDLELLFWSFDYIFLSCDVNQPSLVYIQVYMLFRFYLSNQKLALIFLIFNIAFLLTEIENQPNIT